MSQQDINPMSKGYAESIKTISLLGAIGSWATVAVYLFAGFKTGDSRYITLIIIGAALALLLSLANFLAIKNKTLFATLLFIFAAEIGFIAINLTIANLGIILSIILLAIISDIAFLSSSTRRAVTAIITGIISIVTILFVDTLSLASQRIIPEYWLTTITILAGGIIILVLGIALLRQYQFKSIRSQIIIAFITISVIPLWTVVIPQAIASSSSLETAADQSLSSGIRNISSGFDSELNSLQKINANDANLLAIFELTKNDAERSKDILTYLETIKKRNENILSYSVLDKDGKILIDTQLQTKTININSASDIQSVIAYKKTSISNIDFDLTTNKHVFYINSPILDDKQNIGTILRMKVNADIFQSEISEQAENQEADITAMLVDADGIILANSSSPETRFKLIAPLPKERLTILQQKQILPSGNTENLIIGSPDLAKGLSPDNQNTSFYATMPSKIEKINLIKQKRLATNNSWKIIIGRAISSFSDATNNQIRATIIITIIVMLVALAAAIVTSNLLTSPINYLAAVSERVSRGELNIPLELKRRDEIGRLSKTLNITAIELNKTLETLENQVAQRTADLTEAVQNTGTHAKQLRSIIEITRATSSIQNINELLHDLAKKISLTLGFNHIGIFLLDQTGQYAILKASNSEGGQRMIEKGYQVKISQNETVGFVISLGQPITASDIGENAVIFNNPELPNTRSQIVLPLHIGESIIGALDIQSNEEYIFTHEDIDNLSLLASQISIAIQNAQLFEQTRIALEEAQTFYRQSAAASWRDVLRQGSRGYRFLNGNIETIKAAGSNSGNSEQIVEQKATNTPEVLNIPINIRGKNLGSLRIHQAGRHHAWSNSEIRVYQSIVDRISFALENARLYQDAQRRAAKERVISEIAAKISGSVNMDNILQTAVEELGHVLPGSEVIIQFEHDDNEPNTEFKLQE